MRVVASWEDLAACRGKTSLMYPVTVEGERVALAICSDCPVFVECGDVALDRREAHGVWGGMTESGRRIVLRARARARAVERHTSAVTTNSP
jgi:WhiB family redox-sensing transcriptional regulator